MIDLISELKSWNVKVLVHDPIADSASVDRYYGLKLSSDKEIEGKGDSLVVAVGHKPFRNFRTNDLKRFLKNGQRVIADVKSLYDRETLVQAGFSVFRL